MLGIVIGVASNLSDLSRLAGLKTDVLSAFNEKVMGGEKIFEPDVGIDSVTLQKIQSPSGNFPYYKYKATIALRNYGEIYDDGGLIATAAGNQKKAFVANKVGGLHLEKGQTFIVDDYELLMDGKYNYGKFIFNLESKEGKDGNLENNSYFLDVFEEPLSLGSLAVDEKAGDSFKLSFLPAAGKEEKVKEMVKEVCYLDWDKDGGQTSNYKYSEVYTNGDVYSYYRVPVSKDFISGNKFKCEEVKSVGEGNTVKFYGGLNKTLFLIAHEKDNKSLFALSSGVNLPENEFMTKADFAKNFVEEAGLKLKADGGNYFSDVSQSEWYAPYVDTMFNYGLISQASDKDFTFNPDQTVLRQDVLEPLLNYFDVELKESEGAPHFYDIKRGSKEYFFVEGLYASGKAKALGIKFYPLEKASKNFLTYLTYEFKKKQN